MADGERQLAIWGKAERDTSTRRAGLIAEEEQYIY